MHLPTLFRSAALATAVAAACAPALGSDLPSYATGEESIKGTIASISGKYRLTVRDQRGYIDDVTLHDGTVINPTGLTLATGQSVTILGRNAGSTFAASEIDTPYSERSGVTYAYPYLVGDPYAGAPYVYGYPAYPYAYGPSASIGFFFGSGYYGGYGHGYYGHGYYGHGYYGHGYYGHGYYGHGYYGNGGYGRGSYNGHGGGNVTIRAGFSGRGNSAGRVGGPSSRGSAGSHGHR